MPHKTGGRTSQIQLLGIVEESPEQYLVEEVRVPIQHYAHEMLQQPTMYTIYGV